MEKRARFGFSANVLWEACPSDTRPGGLGQSCADFTTGQGGGEGELVLEQDPELLYGFPRVKSWNLERTHERKFLTTEPLTIVHYLKIFYIRYLYSL